MAKKSPRLVLSCTTLGLVLSLQPIPSSATSVSGDFAASADACGTQGCDFQPTLKINFNEQQSSRPVLISLSAQAGTSGALVTVDGRAGVDEHRFKTRAEASIFPSNLPSNAVAGFGGSVRALETYTVQGPPGHPPTEPLTFSYSYNLEGTAQAKGGAGFAPPIALATGVISLSGGQTFQARSRLTPEGITTSGPVNGLFSALNASKVMVDSALSIGSDVVATNRDPSLEQTIDARARFQFTGTNGGTLVPEGTSVPPPGIIDKLQAIGLTRALEAAAAMYSTVAGLNAIALGAFGAVATGGISTAAVLGGMGAVTMQILTGDEIDQVHRILQDPPDLNFRERVQARQIRIPFFADIPGQSQFNKDYDSLLDAYGKRSSYSQAAATSLERHSAANAAGALDLGAGHAEDFEQFLQSYKLSVAETQKLRPQVFRMLAELGYPDVRLVKTDFITLREQIARQGLPPLEVDLARLLGLDPDAIAATYAGADPSTFPEGMNMSQWLALTDKLDEKLIMMLVAEDILGGKVRDVGLQTLVDELKATTLPPNGALPDQIPKTDVIPEPNSFILFLTGLALFVGYSARKSSGTYGLWVSSIIGRSSAAIL
jgi:hypothetical protein